MAGRRWWWLGAVVAVGLAGRVEAGCWRPVEPAYEVDEYDDVRCKDLRGLDLSGRAGLVETLWFNGETVWPGAAGMPAGCDPGAIMEAAKNPGLGVRELHAQGFTGAGVSVAIIDQELYLDHPEYAGKIAAYHDLGEHDRSMHGPAVASLLVGEQCGTAPGARLYYVGCSQNTQTDDYAAGLDWIVGLNETLPAAEKIRVVSISAAPGDPQWTYRAEYLLARERAEAAGILVLDVTRWVLPCWLDMEDPEDTSRCTPGFPGMEPYFYSEAVLVPSSPRSTAESVYPGDYSYQYTGRGGMSWSMPYCAGVLAMGWQVRPDLSGPEMIELLGRTAHVQPRGARIIDPAVFMDYLCRNLSEIELSQREFEFVVGGDSGPQEQTLLVRNVGVGLLKWHVLGVPAWLRIEPSMGTLQPGEEAAVTVDVGAVRPGVYTATMEVYGWNAFNSGLEITGRLYARASWTRIQQLIDHASAGKTIVLEPGVYCGEFNRDLDFGGKAIRLRSVDPADPAVVAATVIHCEGSAGEEHRGFIFRSGEGPDTVVEGLTITGGHAGWGGAVLCRASSPTFRNCVFERNYAIGGGAIETEDGGEMRLENCVFTRNTAEFVGGAIRNHTSSPTLLNCLIVGNAAGAGGAMQNENDVSNPVLIGCTIAGNRASWGAGGILNAGDAPVARPILRNTIVWGNRSGEFMTTERWQILGGGAAVSYSCVEGWSGQLGGVGNGGGDPRFVSAGQWLGGSWVEGDYHLRYGSGCIDAGDPGYDGTGERDMDGRPRVGRGRVDVGADEYRGADVVFDGVVDVADLAAVAGWWLEECGGPDWCGGCDVDQSEWVDLVDFGEVGGEWGW